MNYWVVWHSGWSRPRWKRFAGDSGATAPILNGTPTLGCTMKECFYDRKTAILAIIDVMLASTDDQWCRFAVVDDYDQIVWAEEEDYKHDRHLWKSSDLTVREIYDEFIVGCITSTTEPQEDTNMGCSTEITTPLHVPRQALIDRLSERRDEEIAKREEAAKAGAARRQLVLDAVEQLTDDQVANILNQYVIASDPDALVKWVNEAVENKKFVSKEAAPTSTETTLDRLISVLGLANDETIEVKPTDPVYPLL